MALILPPSPGVSFQNVIDNGTIRVCANRGEIPANTTTAGTSSVRIENRKYYTLGGAAQRALRVVYCGFYVTTLNVETAVGNSQTVFAALEIPGVGPVTVPFTWSGATSGTITSGVARLVSDWIYPYQFGLSSFAAGMTFFIRDCREVTSGQIYNRNPSTANMTGEGTFLSDGTTGRQYASTGAMSVQTGGSQLNRCFGPVCIEGMPLTRHDIAVLTVGDSILLGSNDTNQPSGSDGSNGGGWVNRALISVNGRAVPVLTMAYFGTGVNQFLGSMSLRQQYWPFTTHAIENYGTNDYGSLSRTPAQVNADKATLWSKLKYGGLQHIEVVPILQRCGTTTDTYQTVANQTPNSGYAVGGAFRDVVNTAITAAVGGAINAVLDVGSVTRDATNTDRWVANGTSNYATSDGTHPSPAASALMAPVAAARVATWTA